MSTLKITLQTKTPIWTGGIDGTTDRLHETGIIGSLRWWYEAIVRGLGHYACDPVGDNGCQYDPQKGTPPEEQLCPACYVFGATGWKRRFRLDIFGKMHNDGPVGAKEPTGKRFNRKGDKRPKWFFPGPGKAGDFSIIVTPLFSEFDPRLLQDLITLIVKVGALGAKTQLGYGLIKFQEGTAPETQDVLLSSIPVPETSAETQPLPSLKNMFFAELESPDKGITGTLNLKYDIREAFRTTFTDTDLRHFIMGTVKGQRQAGKISISQAVDGRMRIWGWVPGELPVDDVSRDDIIQAIYDTANTYGEVTRWREFDAPRRSPPFNDPRVFFENLLKEGDHGSSL